MTSEINLDTGILHSALASAGRIPRLRAELFDALRRAEVEADDPAEFREAVRWPLVLSLLSEAKTHQVALQDGLLFEVSPDSRIEKALLLSTDPHPDHVWEPQTTRLLVSLSRRASHVIVGGAYIGDHVLPIAKAIAPTGQVHAFEPMKSAFERLVRNVELNGLRNVVPQPLSLWDSSGVRLSVDGPLALASSVEAVGTSGDTADWAESVTLSDYLRSREISSVELIMLDTEGGEERALHGSVDLLELPATEAPNVVFEVHRNFVDWSDGLEKTSIVRMLTGRGYTVFAIRDLHDNYSFGGQPIEVVPADRVYLEGPPHGFNMLATKDETLLERLGLEVVFDVSPKLLVDRDPALHHPRRGFR